MFTLVLPRKALSLSLTKVLPQIWKYLANQKTKTSSLVAWPQNTGKEKVWPLQSVDGWHARYHFNDRHVWVSLKMNYLQGILLYFHTEISRIHSLHSTGGRTVIFGLQKSNGQFAKNRKMQWMQSFCEYIFAPEITIVCVCFFVPWLRCLYSSHFTAVKMKTWEFRVVSNKNQHKSSPKYTSRYLISSQYNPSLC